MKAFLLEVADIVPLLSRISTVRRPPLPPCRRIPRDVLGEALPEKLNRPPTPRSVVVGPFLADEVDHDRDRIGPGRAEK